MEEKPSSQKTNSTKNIISIILIIIGIIIIALFLWLIFSEEEVTFTGGKTTSSKEVVNNGSNSSTTISEENTNEENKKNDPEAKARDEQRISDIEEIRSALTSFFDDKGNYPEKMGELVSEGYLSELPKNPTPGGIDYVYTPIGSLPAQYYDLAYSLEAGTDEIEAGSHIANPDGVAYP